MMSMLGAGCTRCTARVVLGRGAGMTTVELRDAIGSVTQAVQNYSI